ncbi:MAG: GlxA family transcriptional regulator [Acidiferrobacterales bacterium]|nr:GlxA family transcriptional regulator [Acidiferrobacterales bacterium]
MIELDYGCVKNGAERSIGFVLFDSFNMLPFISALEPLRIANRLAKKPLYQWRLISEQGENIVASNGMTQSIDCSIEDSEAFSMLVVSGPFHPENFDSPSMLSWLQEQAEQKILIAGLETGCHILAAAGLLEGLQCTTHWENMGQFKDEWPSYKVSSDVYEIDQNRLTCSGGAASMDMMLYVIEQHHGHELAASVADSMIHPNIRSTGEPQRMDIQSRTGVTHPDLLECIELIEANVEQPLTPAELANLVGISKRQLERLFRRYLNTTPARYYLTLRLETAKGLLEKSSMKIIDVAIACGFKSAGHFSSRYFSSFGETPRETRNQH